MVFLKYSLFDFEAETEYMKHTWSVNRSHDEVQAVILKLAKHCDSTWPCEIVEMVLVGPEKRSTQFSANTNSTFRVAQITRIKVR